ncbi:MAG: ATP-binding protein [Candidatus Njordarchaeia archaeon]
MSLYSEALTLKRLAEKSLERGDKQRAVQFLKRAIRNLEILEMQSSDEDMLQIWRKAKKTMEEMLNNIDKYVKERTKKIQELEGGPKVKHTTRKEDRREFKRSQGKGKTRGAKGELIKECESDVFTAELPDITFKDVADMEDVKKELKESIEWQIKYPDMLEKLKLKPLKGILMYGPPGTGKTFLVKAAAGEFKLPLIIADPASIMSKYVGESEKVVKKMFDCARAMAPSIIFVDEVDKVLPLQSSSSDAPKRVEAQFLQEMDGVKSSEGTIVVFATNEPWNISPALIRPGRIDRIIYVGPPNRETRRQLFELYLKNVPLADDVKMDHLLELTEPNNEGYYSASGIAQICNEVKKILMRRYTEKGELTQVTLEDFINAIKKVPRSISHRMIKQYESWGLEHSTF